MPSLPLPAWKRAVALLLLTLGLCLAAAPQNASALYSGTEDEQATAYREILLKHTKWMEERWDPILGAYEPGEGEVPNLSALVGNAVLLKFGTYDEAKAGVSKATLLEHTVDSIEHYAARNFWVEPGHAEVWGGNIYWVSTYESYFALAAKLLWSDINATARTQVNTMLEGMADYVEELEGGIDLKSKEHWKTEGLKGEFYDNSDIEEMGAKVLPLAAGLAYLPGDANASGWKLWMNNWATNLVGLPAANEANKATLEGKPVSQWMKSENIYPTFLVENHSSVAPLYATSPASQGAHALIQFLVNEQSIPDTLRTIPNFDEVWRGLDMLGTNAGVAADLAVDDRHHLYGSWALPLAARTVIAKDTYAARAEKMLLERLPGYVDYAPAGNLNKFSGLDKYEPEARAEIAVAYLLHYWRATLNGAGWNASPVTEAKYFEGRSGTVDHGTDLGFINQQTPKALAAAITKPSWVKYAYMPQHDDWLFDYAGKVASFMPTIPTVSSRKTHTYRNARDGYDATATLLKVASSEWTGFTTLPDGKAVYATSGIAEGEGVLNFHNRNMTNVPGLDGNRTFTAASGSATYQGDLADGYVDDIVFSSVSARYVKFQGIDAATSYGFSLRDFEVRNGAGGSDLAKGKTPTAISEVAGWEAKLAFDGDSSTIWSHASKDRACECGWIYVDLGSAQTIDRVKLNFDPAYGKKYEILTSTNGSTWTTRATVPYAATTFTGNWLNVDSRAGFVVRGSSNSISVASDKLWLSDGSASGSNGMVVEARPEEAPAATEAAAAVAAPTGVGAVEASLAGGYLSLFNLSDSAVTNQALTLPQTGTLKLYRGTQTVRTSGTAGTDYSTTIDAADARVEAPRFLLTKIGGGALPALKLVVTDSTSMSVENPGGGSSVEVKVETADGAKSETVTVASGAKKSVTFSGVALTPTTDLARTEITFPTSPLPAEMTDPDNAVDGNAATTWTPGPNGRMVVDLGENNSLTGVKLTWTSGTKRPVNVETSLDGLNFGVAATAAAAGGTEQTIAIKRPARYVAVAVPAWTSGDATLANLEVEGTAGATVVSNGDGNFDEVFFTPVKAKYVKFQGVDAATEWGFTLEDFEVYGGGSSDLALSKEVKAISKESESWKPEFAVDGNSGTAWSHAKADRACECGWIYVNLGSEQTIDRVKLNFDPAYGAAYKIQVSNDATTWTDAAVVPTVTNGDGNFDEVNFAPVETRHVRFRGIAAGSEFGFSLEDFEVFGGTGSNLALSKTATASSEYEGGANPPSKAVDASSVTMWSSSKAQRPFPEEVWFSVDLGSTMSVRRVKLNFDAAFAAEYKIQVSPNGSTWTDVAETPLP